MIHIFSDMVATWVYYDNAEEREEAIIYINIWKKFAYKYIKETFDNDYIWEDVLVEQPIISGLSGKIGMKLERKEKENEVKQT